VARVLIVGCGCRARELAAALVRDGHAVRGTTRRDSELEAIEATGAEGAVADPIRLATLVPHLDGVAILCWPMGSVVGEPEAIAAIHGPRLRSLLERTVDTPVRGVVYEAAGCVEQSRLDSGARTVREAGQRWRIPVEVVTQDPAEHPAWLAAMQAAIDRLLGSS
jgi:hypothetical protein